MKIEHQALNDARTDAQAEVKAQRQQLADRNKEIKDLTLSIGQQVNELLHLNSLLQAKDKELSSLESKLSTQEATQQELRAQLEQLRGDIAIQNDEMNSLRQQLEHSAAVNKEPKNTDIYFNRTLQMAHVEVAIQALDAKANDLEIRKAPLAACTAARDLAKEIRAEIKRYAASDKPEDEALSDFKVAIKDHITTAEKELGQHRQKWKYVIANISLAVALVGVGYLIAALVNKGVTGNFTFFSKTNSTEHLENLQAVVGNTKGIAG